MRWKQPSRTAAIGVTLALIIAGCASAPRKAEDDPLRNTKKLVAEGHRTLYENGAFQVPHTQIKLIPAGPGTMDLAGEMMGMRARESLTTALANAADSVQVVAEGTTLSYRTAGTIHESTEKGVDAIKKMSRENSTLLMYRSSELGKNIIGSSWDLSKRTMESGSEAGKGITHATRKIGDALDTRGVEAGAGLATSSLDAAKTISVSGTQRSGKELSYAGSSFVVGYATVPKKMKQHAASMGDHLTEAGFSGIVKEENERRSKLSAKSVDLFADTMNNYGSNVAGSFRNAGNELEGSYRTTGISLAVLKSVRWVLQGILWDATVKPIANVTAASIGYIGVNFVAFPTLVVVREGVATTALAVEVTWDATKMGYDIVAPTGTAAVAGVFGVLDFTGSNLAAGATAAGGTALGYTGAAASKTAAVVVKGAGEVAGTTVHYIGVPLASAGIAVGGGTIGTAVGAAGTATAGTVFVSGEAAAVTTKVFGNVISGATLVGGTAASVGAGAAYGVYEVSKAVVVPAGYELGGGIVLSYGTLSHLAAHSVLAASDCAYVVLSLEGPRWVIYAVKGNVSSGNDLAGGAVVDLQKLRQQGEEIYNIQVTDEEMKKIVDSVYENLPEAKEREVTAGE
jgi:hypothetical protein